ncbi:hypothetical protein M413DRAFT_31395 [Hebeloma cylindrosporum]|uniref:Uncharacterized protein n=1 Tax=Hebeloma cylindrosporum TaxID=76867 RepID=A0A0C3BZ91_HEBCY|nr:hypothetical protein M413DRAFT_31395 [Hebeloma cylindrosporum h7]
MFPPGLNRRGLEKRDLSKRAPAASPCSPLDLDDAQSLPGWGQFEQYARTKWGDGDWTITINPPGYKDKPATMCVADPVVVEMTGEPECVTTRVDIEPEKRNSNNIKVDEGYRNVGNWNITNVTAAAHAEFFSGNFLMPNITKLELFSLKATGKFINAPHNRSVTNRHLKLLYDLIPSRRNSFTTVASNITLKPTELTSVQDKRCIGTVNNQQCIVPSRGRIQLVASGYIWFNYKTKRAPLANPKGGKHSRYTIKVEDVLKNATDRSVWIDFSGYMNTTMRSDYFDECRWNFQL